MHSRYMTDHARRANIEVDAAGRSIDGKLWVFAYGSLIWKPAFEYISAQPALIYGYHRDFCVHSVVHRGTYERSGLVLGLAPGGACRGMLFEIAPRHADAAIEALDARELVTDVYRPAQVKTRAPSGEAQARTYICDTAHAEYAGRLDIDDMARRILGAVGDQGPNEEYLINTVHALREMALHDVRLEAVYEKIVAAMTQ